MKSQVIGQPMYSVAALIRSKIADTWTKMKSLERIEHEGLCEAYGPCKDMRSIRLPEDALAIRDMTASGMSGSQYLVGVSNRGYLPTLQPASVVLRLGANTYDAGEENATFPKGTTGTTTQWLADENSAITESQPVFGKVSAAPKILAALTEISHQMLQQSNAEIIVRQELARAAGAALDAAALAGSGASGQPTGIVNWPSIGGFAGATLNRSGLTNAQGDVALANASGANRGYVTTPAVAGVLQNRADTIASTSPVWVGSLADGQMIGERAIATTGMPSASMLYGEWTNLTLVSWGTLEIAVDPFTKFNQGLVAVRLLMLIDSIVTNASGFTLSTSIN